MSGNCSECDRWWYCVIDPEKCDNLSEPVLTNADQIRSMSDEELAQFLNQWGTSTRAWQKDKGETMYWLQQPSEADE